MPQKRIGHMEILRVEACLYENIETDEYCISIRLQSGFNIFRNYLL